MVKNLPFVKIPDKLGINFFEMSAWTMKIYGLKLIKNHAGNRADCH